ncbi:serine/threonine protein kinase [Isosphaera pallida ATCC 43644]|uniref:Serine/threonine protein kinase n=1 Tax=Isosphaera pallida (strain ATCC 43644 / DSM 9630 / IS1B) TaxID=575540 RepID=E8R435_ISOPI|nr:protein kinase [Isosphaera pallida]ADV61622.1 serine/threonine protein kinase [Isosphaera pallida ATCC 43644]
MDSSDVNRSGEPPHKLQDMVPEDDPTRLERKLETVTVVTERAGQNLPHVIRWDRFRLEKVEGLALDGWAIRHHAVDEVNNQPCKVYDLSELKRLGGSSTSSWVARLTLAARLDHPRIRKVLAWEWNRTPPYVALAQIDEAKTDSLTPPPSQAFLPAFPFEIRLAHARGICQALADGHALGLTVGSNALRRLSLRTGRLDFTRLDEFGVTRSRCSLNLDDLSRRSCPPEETLNWLQPMFDTAVIDRADAIAEDLLALGECLSVWLHDDKAVCVMAARLVQSDPHLRPAVATVVELLEQRLDEYWRELAGRSGRGVLHASTRRPCTHSDSIARRDPSRVRGFDVGDTLGRYELLERLGKGGMGVVFKARDLGDGSIVALKLIRLDLAYGGASGRESWGAIRARFRREARLLAECNNPHVARLLEFNEDQGCAYLALEFVDGENLGDLIEREGRLPEALALEIALGITRGLEPAHQRGIIHRDLKPDNVLLTHAQPRQVKVIDFGLARREWDGESNQLTLSGMIVGTPRYMSPEQCDAGPLTVRSDVYSIGVTLYQMLTGRPPFESASLAGLITLHRQADPPPLEERAPETSEATRRLVAALLAKRPEDRPADAGTVAHLIERILRGQEVVVLHPRMPQTDPRNVVSVRFTWTLKSNPRALWPLVSNTERLNRAIGLPAVEFGPVGRRADGNPAGVGQRPAQARKFGLNLRWTETPFEWVEGRRMGVLREFVSGPFVWLTSLVELTPVGLGTELSHTISYLPRTRLGRWLGRFEVNVNTRRNLDRVYRRIDAALQGELANQDSRDPFEPVQPMTTKQRAELDRRLDRLVALGINPRVVERLGELIAWGSAQDLARIRPLEWAARAQLPPEAVLIACLHGIRQGIFQMRWDVICPVCRVASESRQSLRDLHDRETCPACRSELAIDFSSSVEMIVKAHPDLRTTDSATYCLGGPAHSPHVVAQILLEPRESFVLDLDLEPGRYRLRFRSGSTQRGDSDSQVQPRPDARDPAGSAQPATCLDPQEFLPIGLDWTYEFWVWSDHAPTTSWSFRTARGPQPNWPEALRTGGQVLAIHHDSPHEALIRVERVARREDALTAARLASHPVFRRLFPTEALEPGRLIPVESICLLAARFHESTADGDREREQEKYHEFQQFLEWLQAQVEEEQGVLLKTFNDGALAVFDSAASAVRTALKIHGSGRNTRTHGQTLTSGWTNRLGIQVALHQGPAWAATLDGRLDYFGATLKMVDRICDLAAPGEIWFTSALFRDPDVTNVLRWRRMEAQIVMSPSEDVGMSVHRIRPSEHPEDPSEMDF